MGRYAFGDIDHKYWFAVQNSDAADRFGVTGVEPSELYYYLDRGNLEDVEENISVIKKQLGKHRTKMKEFFKSNSAYTDEALAKYLDLPEAKVKTLLSAYADYELGMKIRKSILETGQCEFTAEY